MNQEEEKRKKKEVVSSYKVSKNEFFIIKFIENKMDKVNSILIAISLIIIGTLALTGVYSSVLTRREMTDIQYTLYTFAVIIFIVAVLFNMIFVFLKAKKYKNKTENKISEETQRIVTLDKMKYCLYIEDEVEKKVYNIADCVSIDGKNKIIAIFRKNNDYEKVILNNSDLDNNLELKKILDFINEKKSNNEKNKRVLKMYTFDKMKGIITTIFGVLLLGMNFFIV
ncbi:MAG: hypothetical protein ACRC57_05065 [Sarcina sp.]